MNSAHPFYPILIPHTPYMHFTGVPRIYDKVKVTDYKTTDYRATIQIGKKKKILYSIYDKVVDYKTTDYRATIQIGKK